MVSTKIGRDMHVVRSTTKTGEVNAGSRRAMPCRHGMTTAPPESVGSNCSEAVGR